MIDFNQFINEKLNEAKKFYTTKEIVKLAQAAGDFVLDAKDAIQDLAVAYGNKVPAKELDKVLANYDLEIEDLMEAYDGTAADFKYEFPMAFEEATGNSSKAIKKIAKKGKGFEVRTSTYMSEPEMKKVADVMGMELVSYNKDSRLAISIFESAVTEAKPAGLSKKETLKVAQKFAAALTKLDGKEYTVNPDYEEDSFDLDFDGEEYAGGSYNINADGSVVNMAVWNKKNVSPTYGNMDDDIKTIIKTIKNLKESVVTEGKKVTLKRRYTENYPAITAGKHARIRNKMLEAIGDGKITQEEFDNILKELSSNGKRWSRNNAKYFNVSEEGISLSKFGRRALASITINEEQPEINKKPLEMKVNEKTTKNPEVWVPGAFDKALSKMPNSKITYDVVKDLAKKHKVFLDDAIAYVEYGWDLDLQENKNNQMKSNFIYESFSSFVENELNEAFKSSKLANMFRNNRGKIDKNLAQAFYSMSKIKMDQVEDHDIIEMDPKTAYKDKRESAVYFYFTRNEKENPYATSDYKDDKTIPANTLLAITNGDNKFYGVNWKRYGEKGYVMNLGSAGDSAGIGKSHSKYGGTGLSNMKRVSDVADVAYVLDLNVLRNRYDARALKDTRSAAKAGAIAFKTDKEFKQENLNRYNTIIANRAVQMPIDKMVADAIDTLSAQIKDALVKGEKTRYNEILLGRTPKGREAKIQDAANHMQRILDDFQRYVSYTNQAEEEKKAGYGGDYYAREVKNYAKNITDRIKQIETFSYAW